MKEYNESNRREWTGVVWFSIWTFGRLLYKRHWTFRFHEMHGIFWLAFQGLYLMALVCFCCHTSEEQLFCTLVLSSEVLASTNQTDSACSTILQSHLARQESLGLLCNLNVLYHIHKNLLQFCYILLTCYVWLVNFLLCSLSWREDGIPHCHTRLLIQFLHNKRLFSSNAKYELPKPFTNFVVQLFQTRVRNAWECRFCKY